MNIKVLTEAWADLDAGRDFYDNCEVGVGDYFAASMAADIESLRFFAGIHSVHFGYHRALAKRFPFAVYYLVKKEVVEIHAVLDLRMDPASIRGRLEGDSD
jgi:hypothetical protein